MRILDPAKKRERGVTILIVGITLLAMVAMAVLAIDVASLYQARNEAQRAADAAALAGARMFVTSSYTSTTLLSFSVVCQSGGPGSTAAVNKQAEAAALVNSIAGQPAAIKTVQCNNSNPLNPWVTVTVQRASAPTFFARIWGISTSSITATATAEAYNASGQNLPIGLTNVKPWLIPNCDPGGGDGPCGGGFFVNPSDGTIQSSGSFVGAVLHLTRQTSGKVGGDGSGGGMGGTLRFYGLRYPASPAPVCPSSSAVSCDDPAINNGGVDTYIDNIACVSSLPMYCGQQIGSTATPQILFEGSSPLTGTPTVVGTKCLIHAGDNGFNQGQDVVSPGVPVVINGGGNNPNPSLSVPNISRSDSVVTAPLFDGRQMDNSSSVPATVIGFLQLGVQETNAGGFGGGQLLDAVVLNVVGCSPNAIAAYPPGSPPANALSAGGSSPIPVRLVQNP